MALDTYMQYISATTSLCGEQEAIFTLLGKAFSIFISHGKILIAIKRKERKKKQNKKQPRGIHKCWFLF